MGSQLPLKGARPPVFGSCLLWPNSWMDEGATWYGSRPWPRAHCIRWRPSSPRKGHSIPLLSARVYCGHGRPSQLLLSSCFQNVTQACIESVSHDVFLCAVCFSSIFNEIICFVGTMCSYDFNWNRLVHVGTVELCQCKNIKGQLRYYITDPV